MATATAIARGLVLMGLAALLAACGGGGTGTKVLTVDFRYADVQSDVRAPLSVAPVLTGLDGHKPTCTPTGGSLPPGLALDASSCVLSGTPMVAGAYTVGVTLTAKDVEGALDVTVFLNIVDPTPAIVKANPVPSGPLSTDVSLQYAQALAPTVLATIGPGYVAKPGDAISYAVVSGTLPSGVTFEAANGTVQGTPTGFGVSTIQLAATLTRGGIAYTSAPIAVTLGVSALSLSASYPVCLVGVGTVVTCAPQLGNPAAFVGLTLLYSAIGLPAGVSIDPASGVISGLLVVVGDVMVAVNLHATYPSGAAVDAPAFATLRAANVLPFYDPTPANVGVVAGPGPSIDGLGDQTAQLRSGQAFSINVTGYNLSVPGDVHVFSLLDAGIAVPAWVSIDASTGRLSGIAPVGPVTGTWRVRLVTTRGGMSYPFDRRWIVTLVP